MYRILIVEDDRGIAQAVKEQAVTWGLEAECVQNFRDVMAEFAVYNPHLVLMDIALPFYNGYHWCTEIRKVSKVPVIFISSASDNMNIVMAMNMGGDDFIAKPFDQGVLIAKVQAMLRRTYDFASTIPTEDLLPGGVVLGDLGVGNGDTTLGGETGASREAVEALVALGYSMSEAAKAVRQVEMADGMTAETVLKASLKYLI